MKIKTLKIHIFDDSEYEFYRSCCEFLSICKIHYPSYCDVDDDDKTVWCIELESV